MFSTRNLCSRTRSSAQHETTKEPCFVPRNNALQVQDSRYDDIMDHAELCQKIPGYLTISAGGVVWHGNACLSSNVWLPSSTTGSSLRAKKIPSHKTFTIISNIFYLLGGTVVSVMPKGRTQRKTK